jgi:hypothetical protein
LNFEWEKVVMYLQYSFRLIAGLIAGAFLFPVTCANHASAQNSPSVTAFLANPRKLLTENPNGGTKMVSQIEGLAIDPPTLPTILSLLPDANADQKSAMGTALAQAAKIVVLTNQAYAAQIQRAIVATNDWQLKLAFVNALGDVVLGGEGGRPGSLGGQTDPLNTSARNGTSEDLRARNAGEDLSARNNGEDLRARNNNGAKIFTFTSPPASSSGPSSSTSGPSSTTNSNGSSSTTDSSGSFSTTSFRRASSSVSK